MFREPTVEPIIFESAGGMMPDSTGRGSITTRNHAVITMQRQRERIAPAAGRCRLQNSGYAGVFDQTLRPTCCSKATIPGLKTKKPGHGTGQATFHRVTNF
jgi:hypothetical protein